MEINQQIKEIYNKIANDFDMRRVRIWPCVSDFLHTFNSNSIILDIGCGNGKNMLFKNDLIFKGIDISNKLVDICKKKGLDVLEGSMTSLPYDSNSFDGIITIASYHHLSTDIERKEALDEMYKVLKPNGRALIVVWAMEQPDDSTFHFTKADELVPWKTKLGQKNQTYYRYYHIYSKGDLENEVRIFKPEFHIEQVGWQKGNWYIVLKK